MLWKKINAQNFAKSATMRLFSLVSVSSQAAALDHDQQEPQ
jgi:hypothetical protein